jgi:hypothetical protein
MNGDIYHCDDRNRMRKTKHCCCPNLGRVAKREMRLPVQDFELVYKNGYISHCERQQPHT